MLPAETPLVKVPTACSVLCQGAPVFALCTTRMLTSLCRWYLMERHCHDCTSKSRQHSGASAQRTTWDWQAIQVNVSLQFTPHICKACACYILALHLQRKPFYTPGAQLGVISQILWQAHKMFAWSLANLHTAARVPRVIHMVEQTYKSKLPAC